MEAIDTATQEVTNEVTKAVAAQEANGNMADAPVAETEASEKSESDCG